VPLTCGAGAHDSVLARAYACHEAMNRLDRLEQRHFGHHRLRSRGLGSKVDPQGLIDPASVHSAYTVTLSAETKTACPKASR
jgi:hypothetical protein